MSDTFSIDLQYEDFSVTSPSDDDFVVTLVSDDFDVVPVPSDNIVLSFASVGINGGGLPAGGADGQLLGKEGGVPVWVDPPAGGGGGPGDDDQTAAEVPFTPFSTIAATNVQDAIEELFDETAPLVHSHVSSDISDLAETIRDRIGMTLVQGTGIAITVDDPGNTVTIEATSSGSTSIVNVLSIAQLRSLTGSTVAETAWVLGWHTATLVGGGLFWYDASDVTSADDGALIIVDAASRRWKRVITTSYYNAQWWGTRANGSTNDTTALQNAMNAAKGRMLRVPKGRYLIGGPSAVDYIFLLSTPVNLVGDAAHDRSSVAAGDEGTVLLVAFDTPTTVDAVRITSAAGSIGEGLFFWGIEDIRIRGEAGTGASLTAGISAGAVNSLTLVAGGTRYSPAATVAFSGGGGGSGAAATLTRNPVTGAITGVTITNGGSGYTVAPTAVVSDPGGSGRDCFYFDIQDSLSAFFARFSIRRCWFGPLSRRAISMTKAGTTINGWFTSLIEDSRFDGGLASDYVLWLNRSGDSLTFDNNTITGGGIGIYTAPVGGAAIQQFTNNNITARNGAIYVDGGTQVLIENNQIEQNTTGTVADDANVVLDGSVACVVRGNNILGDHTSGTKVSNILLKAGAIHNVVEDNVMGCEATSGKYHVVNDSAQRNYIDPHQRRLIVDGAIAHVIRTSGTGSNVFGARAIGDANATILPHETIVYPTGALTTGRTWTLPLSADCPPGHVVRVIDHIGVFSRSTPVTVSRQGTNSINGTTTFLLNFPRAAVDFVNQGGGFWAAKPLDNKYSPIGDANYTILAADRVVVVNTAFTAARTWTLPAADDFPVGMPLTIIDMVGGLSAINTLTIQRAGTDTIEGSTSFILNARRQQAVFYSNGVNGWSVARELIVGTHVQELMTADRTYYVRADGSDSNTGLADTAGGAFLTIAKALDTVASLNLGGFVATVQLQSGTWTTPVSLPRLTGGTAVLRGDPTTPANCHINVTGNAITVSNPGWTINGIKFSATVFGIVATNCNSVALQNVDVGTCGNFQIYAASNSVININTNYAISGGAPRHWAVFDGGVIICQSKTITLSGTPAYTSSFAVASRGGSLAVNANTFAGTGATGPRYSATLNGVIDTAGGGATYLPGSVAGTTATGGQYA